LLQGQGYATAAIGKWGLGHFGTTGDPNRQGFELFYGYYGQRHAHNHYPRFLWRNGVKEQLPGNDRTATGQTYSQDKFTQVALEFIRQHRDGPFFLYLPFAVPHLSIQVPEPSLAEYQGKIPEQAHQHRGYLKHPFPRAGYAAMVSHMDRDVGRIMTLVAELGLDKNTLILFTSDNGPTYDRLGGSDSDFFESAGPLRGRKGSTYEGGIRVPLVVRWPERIQAGSTSEQISAFWDLLPTFCDLTGAAVPEAIDGLSLVPTWLAQGEQAQHEFLFWEFPAYGGQQAVRLGDWKATRQNIFKGNRKLELYNLADDLGEQHDVAADHPEIVQRIESILERERTDSALFPIFRQGR
ncbi:MAG: sulfatase-like hydrolase/transferase, partial [Pirellulaceae bacterium]